MEEHWKAVKRILQYIEGSISLGLTLQPAAAKQPLTLQAFSDADWALDIDDRRPLQAHVCILGLI